jgi:hypothetical protein
MNRELLESLEAEWLASPKSAQALPDRLSLLKINLMPEVFQCRTAFNPKTGTTDDGKPHIAGMVVALTGSGVADLDPLTVLRVGSRAILIDGHHRLAAYKSAKRSDAPVRYFTDSPKAALVSLGQENRKTKLTMSSSEKSEWAWRLVCSEMYSKSEECRASGASDGTVGAMRRALKELKAKGEPIPSTWKSVKVQQFNGEEGAQAQATEWANRLTTAFGHAKNLASTGKKQMLRDAIVLAWGPRFAEDLTHLLADELDIEDQIAKHVRLMVEEVGQERFDELVEVEASFRRAPDARRPVTTAETQDADS